MSNQDKASAIADGSEQAGDGAKNSTSPTLETAQASPVAVGEVERAPERIWIDEWERAAKRTVGSYFFVPFNESSVDREDIAEIESVEYVRADLAALSRQPAPVVAAMLQKVREMETEYRTKHVEASSLEGWRLHGAYWNCATAILTELERIASTTHDPDEVDVREQNSGALIDSACYADYHKSCASPKTCQCECHLPTSPVDSPAVDEDFSQYEDELPADMTKEQYDEWYAKSRVDGVGVRMGPRFPPTAQADDLQERAERAATQIVYGHEFMNVPAVSAIIAAEFSDASAREFAHRSTVLEGRLALKESRPIQPVECDKNCSSPYRPRIVGICHTDTGASNVANVEQLLWHLNGKDVRVTVEWRESEFAPLPAEM